MNIINTASRQYATRPADECFPSLDALVSAALADKNLSGERTYNLKDLSVQAVDASGVPVSGSQEAEDNIVRVLRSNVDRRTGNHRDLQLVSPKGEARFTHWSFGQLCRTLGAPASYLRDNLTAELAADCMNHGLQTSAPGTAANLLLRQANGSPWPTVRAATSDSYGRLWDATLYGNVADTVARRDSRWGLPPTWSGEPRGAYRGDRDSFLILTNGGSIVTDPSLTGKDGGEMFRGILIRNSEVGAASVTIEQILFRYICGNHMLWGAVMDRQYRRRHFGNHVERDVIREIARLAWAWAQQSTERDNAIIRGLISHEIAHTEAGVIDELRSLGATKEQAEAAYARCVQTEEVSPRTYWGASQGITRIAQDTKYQDERYALDKLAGLVMARGAKLVAA